MPGTTGSTYFIAGLRYRQFWAAQGSSGHPFRTRSHFGLITAEPAEFFSAYRWLLQSCLRGANCLGTGGKTGPQVFLRGSSKIG